MSQVVQVLKISLVPVLGNKRKVHVKVSSRKYVFQFDVPFFDDGAGFTRVTKIHHAQY